MVFSISDATSSVNQEHIPTNERGNDEMNQITLKDARLNVGKSLEEAAAFAGVHPKHLKRMEEGEATVYLHVQAHLCKLYGISIEHVTTKQHVPNSSKEDNGMTEQRKFSRKAVWLATERHGERLEAIAAERIRLTKELADFQSMGRRRVEDMLVRVHELDDERDELIKPFREQLDKESQQKKVVDLERYVEMFGIGDIDELRAIINKVQNEKSHLLPSPKENVDVI